MAKVKYRVVDGNQVKEFTTKVAASQYVADVVHSTFLSVYTNIKRFGDVQIDGEVTTLTLKLVEKNYGELHVSNKHTYCVFDPSLVFMGSRAEVLQFLSKHLRKSPTTIHQSLSKFVTVKKTGTIYELHVKS